MFLVQYFQPLPGDMGVNLRRRNIRMAEQQLHGAKIRAMVEQVSGKGVTQDVRR